MNLQLNNSIKINEETVSNRAFLFDSAIQFHPNQNSMDHPFDSVQWHHDQACI